MDEICINKLAGKLLRILKNWLDKVIPEQTKDCIRSKVGIVVGINNNAYNVILSEDYETYLEYLRQKQRGEITDEEFRALVAEMSIDNLFTIRNEALNLDDKVIVGFLDNKLTNCFILCKNKGQGGEIPPVGVTDYNDLANKPRINSVTLVGDKTLPSLGIENDKEYVHVQSTASNTWTIIHNLNKYPSVTIIDSAGTEVIGEVEYINKNSIRVIFESSFKGTATLN